jgi:predicted RNase H-like HicB family nuclease
MLRDYMRAAMHRARYEILPDEGTFYGEIPGVDGVYSEGDTLEACRDELEEVLEEWIFVRISRSLPVPELDGLELRVRKVG